MGAVPAEPPLLSARAGRAAGPPRLTSSAVAIRRFEAHNGSHRSTLISNNNRYVTLALACRLLGWTKGESAEWLS
jgi:hypothetical protein